MTGRIRSEIAVGRPESGRSCRSLLVAITAVAFVLNWGWEMAQGSAYVELAALPWDQRLVRCTIAALGDAALTLGIYGIGTLAAGRLRWGLSGDWNVYATGALLGCASALAIEWRGLAFGIWSCNEKMPIVPIAKIGLWPFLQLTMLVPVSFWIARRGAKRTK